MAFLEIAGGAVVGGVVSIGTTLVTEIRRERRVTRDAELEEARAYKRAARLVQDELATSIAEFMVLQQAKVGTPLRWPYKGYQFPIDAWDRFKDLLALHDEVWKPVSAAYALLYFLEAEFDALEPRAIEQEDLEMAKKAVEVIEEAGIVLRKLV